MSLLTIRLPGVCVYSDIIFAAEYRKNASLLETGNAKKKQSHKTYLGGENNYYELSMKAQGQYGGLDLQKCSLCSLFAPPVNILRAAEHLVQPDDMVPVQGT